MHGGATQVRFDCVVHAIAEASEGLAAEALASRLYHARLAPRCSYASVGKGLRKGLWPANDGLVKALRADGSEHG